MKPIAILGLTLLSLGAAANPSGSVAGPTAGLVKQKLAEGWQLSEKTTTLETLPGKPPYHHLGREVLNTRYRFTRGNEAQVCHIRYDSQLERFSTSCQDVSPARAGNARAQ